MNPQTPSAAEIEEILAWLGKRIDHETRFPLDFMDRWSALLAYIRTLEKEHLSTHLGNKNNP